MAPAAAVAPMLEAERAGLEEAVRRLGQLRSLDVEVSAGRSVATDKTLFPRGALVFVGSDGTTDAAEIVLANDNDYQLTLEVRPLLELVRIYDDEG